MKKTIALIAMAFLLAACSKAPAPADPSELTARSDAWEAALNAQDLDALVELYTVDARIMPPNGEISTGRDAVAAEFGAMIDAGLGGTTDIVEAQVSGDLGYIVGTYALSAGDETVDRGKYTEIWERGNDGQWRIASDIWNSDGPVQKPMQGGERTHMLILHEVEDGDRWLSAWRGENSRHALFEQNGAAHVHTMQDPNNPNLTALIISVTDMQKLNAMLTSDEGVAAAAEDGVKADTMQVLMQAN
ncbi:MAG: DUF4440 domain-containing protein [Gammaproteobacteria bacterium]|nr:DUF4440 domain-containing protein [Gammaproteobacteria bacterium]NNL50396.1 DUF4440 domain-containing protein [Woeseiaceae bacterium]